MKRFQDYPEYNDIYIINDSCDKNWKGKIKSNKNSFVIRTIEKNFEIYYQVNTNKNIKYIAIQIEPGSDLENLDFILSVKKVFLLGQ